jgi:hypothetical protein
VTALWVAAVVVLAAGLVLLASAYATCQWPFQPDIPGEDPPC